MPIYLYGCKECDHTTEELRKMSDETMPECVCGNTMFKKITAPKAIIGAAVWDAYESPASGKIIRNERERKEDMKRTKSRPWEGFETERQEKARRAEYAAQDADKAVDKAVDDAVSKMSLKQKEALGI